MELKKFVKIQAKIQRTLVPGIWVPLLRTPHYWKEEWLVKGMTDQCIQEIVDSVNKQQNNAIGFIYQSFLVTENRVKIACFTPSRWMDIVDIKLMKTEEKSITMAKVSSYSTGVLPLSIPGAAFVNPLLCWFPFYDNKFPEDIWLPTIRKGMDVSISVVSKYRAL
mmetsp:Transcript_2280/g.3241  ORF Transcript_2280/g.3241 Transcript_2280/m.3241 type:complete len:165 (+) Transcript_2280:234-728(+)